MKLVPLFTALLLALAAPVLPAAETPKAATPPVPPKLVVTILVDQLCYDYLERYHDLFVAGGFRLLTDHGAFMTFAQYNYAPTVTGPGHASYLSGAPPSVHGIIQNDWVDKNTGTPINCVEDPKADSVGGNPGAKKRSPRNFIGSNFSDEMRLRYQSKVVGISIKDRGAILPAGKKPAGAYWFDSTNGNFITSTYYTKDSPNPTALPAWVAAFNDRKLAESFIGQKWTRLLDPSRYDWPDDAPGEDFLPKETKITFDHLLEKGGKDPLESVVITPFGNQLLTDFAIAAIEGERLGTRLQPDVLCISYSSPDLCGHKFGPYSQEMQDMVLRLDRELARLFAELHKRFGMENVSIVLTADHGVAPTAEVAKANGLDGVRVDSSPLLSDLQTKLVAKFSAGSFFVTETPVDGNFYFDHAALQTRGIDPEQVANFIRDWAYKSGEYQAAYTRTQLLEGRAPGLIGQRVTNGYFPERSGDVLVIPKPYHLPSTYERGTTHGSPFGYDAHVPVIFYGAAFKPGRYADEFYITDIAATLCAALHVSVPSGSIGKPCVKILTEQP